MFLYLYCLFHSLNRYLSISYISRIALGPHILLSKNIQYGLVSTPVTINPGAKDRSRNGSLINTISEPVMRCSLPSSCLWSLLDRGISSQGKSSPTRKQVFHLMGSYNWPPGHLRPLMPLNQPSKKEITLPPGIIVPHYQRKLGLLLNKGDGR